MLENEINELLASLKNDEALKSIDFIKAYPGKLKDTILDRVVSTLSMASLDMESISVDNEDFYGDYQIDINVFCPYEMGSEKATESARKIVKAVVDNRILGVKIGAIESDNQTGCYIIKITLTYSAAYKIGG